MIEKYAGFHKVAHECGTLTNVVLYDGTEQVTIVVDDAEYDFTSDSPFVRSGSLPVADLVTLCCLPVEEDWRDRWLVEHCGLPVVGCKGVAVKGRKCGGSGTVKRIYDVRNPYGNVVARYVELSDGTRTSMHNCEFSLA